MSILSILLIIVCIVLILVILVQNSKGGGLAGNFASNNQIMGVRRTTDIIEKTTWGLAIGMLVLSLMMTPKSASSTEGEEKETVSITKEKAGTNVPAASAPISKPVQTPSNGGN